MWAQVVDMLQQKYHIQTVCRRLEKSVSLLEVKEISYWERDAPMHEILTADSCSILLRRQQARHTSKTDTSDKVGICPLTSLRYESISA